MIEVDVYVPEAEPQAEIFQALSLRPTSFGPSHLIILSVAPKGMHPVVMYVYSQKWCARLDYENREDMETERRLRYIFIYIYISTWTYPTT